jgi:mono/diheme cytochrome c family protein
MKIISWTFALSLLATVPGSLGAQTNGLEGEDRDTWYHLSQGTEFFPLHFLLALNDADTGEPFMKDLERFGFIPDPPGKGNPHGLPVGMTADYTRDLRFGKVLMVGLNCSACHTAVLEMRGRPVLRADGGTNLFDADRFRVSLMKSAQKTIDDPVELAHFVSRLVRQSLRERLEAAGIKDNPLTGLLARRLADRIETVFDAVDGPKKQVADKLQELIQKELQEKTVDPARGIVTRPDDKAGAEAIARAQAKVRLPVPAGADDVRGVDFLEAGPTGEILATLRLLRARLESLRAGDHSLKTPPGFGRVDAFGTARNKLFPDQKGPLDAPVRYPFLWTIKDRLLWYHWDGNTMSRQERNTGEALGVGVILDPDTHESTLRFDNLMRLEKLAMRLTPPTWPREFGAIDPAKAEAGAKHFATFCAKCHDGPKANGSAVIPLAVLGTDPKRVQNIRRPVGGVGFFDAISPILKDTIRKAGGEPEGDTNLWRPSKKNEQDLPEGYPNRALPAVWASPPYLHNGSVPNLYQLLLPAEQRDKTFPVGHREYDPVHLGYTLRPARTRFLFDTRVPGNSNAGHSGPAYGTDQLTDDQRWELIEYFKTHK